MMIGNTVKFKDYCDVINTGEVVEIFSEKFDEVKFDNKKIMYWSKKGKKYRDVKEKDLKYIFLEIKLPRNKTDFIYLDEVITK